MTLPSGTVTLLLADVEDSTRMWETSSEQARASMADLGSVVDELVAKFDGARPLEQGEGDSFVAAFARPSDAVGCALELQRVLTDGRLRLRIGVHTGEVELRDGRYDGTTIIRAARLRDLGHGGQTLVSSTTRALVEDSVPDGAGFADVGTHRLKGLERAERIFQLTHPELPGGFPALRSFDAAQRLPVRLTRFIGRTDEVVEVRRMLAESRLVTLTGAGGCGKTRLALEALDGVIDAYEDVWWCDLAGLADPEMVGQALRQTVGLNEDGARSDVEIVTAHLAARASLVVLDNCEHLVDACAVLAQALLLACPRVTVVATTREPLGVEGEVAWRVPSLRADDAVALFVDRAAHARRDFTLGEENAAAVDEICRRLDGIPLAIQLAAARVRALSVAQIVSGLNDRFRLLGRGSRTVLARQQTLRVGRVELRALDGTATGRPATSRRVLRRLHPRGGRERRLRGRHPESRRARPRLPARRSIAARRRRKCVRRAVPDAGDRPPVRARPSDRQR
jgi:class 3 adenylate cyclase